MVHHSRERKTWTKYLVEAENAEDAFEDDEDWEYLVIWMGMTKRLKL
jgi:hypothetical protein